ncbi:MAG: TIR domain-containing protein [Chitinophagales bacterium]|nr:TIR domain-containing protein [Chitinophagales bacterium]
MAKRQIFYSFHYDNDVFRVQQIRNIGALEDNKPVSPNDWETVKKGGDRSIQKWIDENLKYKSSVVVLVGEETANRKWVKYEIQKAWELGKGLVGIHIHNLKDPRTGKSSKGDNPFDQFTFNDGTKLSSVVKCYNPSVSNAYNDIKDNLEDWIEEAIKIRNNH